MWTATQNPQLVTPGCRGRFTQWLLGAALITYIFGTFVESITSEQFTNIFGFQMLKLPMSPTEAAVFRMPTACQLFAKGMSAKLQHAEQVSFQLFLSPTPPP